MENTNTRFVNILRFLALAQMGFGCAALIAHSFAPDSQHLVANWFWLLTAGAVVPPWWASRRDRGWRVKSPFYRISDDCDLLERVERLEQRVTSSS